MLRAVAQFSFSGHRIYFGNTSVEFDDGEKAGTPPFMAPEVIDQRAYGRAADWWSAGVVLFKMYTGRLPFRANDENGLREIILTRPVTFPKLSKGVKFIKKVPCLIVWIIPSAIIGDNFVLASLFRFSIPLNNFESGDYTDNVRRHGTIRNLSSRRSLFGGSTTC